jgi:hypothetical protein
MDGGRETEERVDLQRPERRLQRERRRFGLEDEKSPRRVE